MLTPVDLLDPLRRYKYAAMFGILAISAMGIPIPEEVVLIASGLAVGWEWADFWLSAVACVLGIIAGDLFIFSMGRYCGPWFLSLRPVRRLYVERRREKVRRYFERHGPKTVFFGRFIAGVRFGVFLYAGEQRMNPWKFLAIDLTAAWISGPVTILLGAYAARKMGDPQKAADLAKRLVGEGYVWLYVLIGLIVLAGIARWLLIRRREARPAPPPEGSGGGV